MLNIKKVIEDSLTTIHFYQERCNQEGMYSVNKQPIVINTIVELTTALHSLNHSVCPICGDGHLYTELHTSCDTCGSMCEGVNQIVYNKKEREKVSRKTKIQLINDIINEIETTNQSCEKTINILLKLRDEYACKGF